MGRPTRTPQVPHDDDESNKSRSRWQPGPPGIRGERVGANLRHATHPPTPIPRTRNGGVKISRRLRWPRENKPLCSLATHPCVKKKKGAVLLPVAVTNS